MIQLLYLLIKYKLVINATPSENSSEKIEYSVS